MPAATQGAHSIHSNAIAPGLEGIAREFPDLPASSPCLMSDFLPKPVRHAEARKPFAQQGMWDEREDACPSWRSDLKEMSANSPLPILSTHQQHLPAMTSIEDVDLFVEKIEAAFGKGLEALQQILQAEQEKFCNRIEETMSAQYPGRRKNTAGTSASSENPPDPTLSPVRRQFTTVASKHAQRNAQKKRSHRKHDPAFHLGLMHRMSAQNEMSVKRQQRVENFFAWAQWDGATSQALASIVRGHYFNAVCSLMMLLFAATVGIESDIDIRAALSGDAEPTWPKYANACFNMFFGLEVCARMIGERIEFFIGHDWRWNIFDLVLVLVSIFDLIVGGMNLNFFRVVRVLKILRALKIVRVLRWFHELRVLLSTIFNSLASLCWTLMFLGIVTFLCSVAIVQGAANHIKDESSELQTKTVVRKLIEKYFPNMTTSMYTLIGAITGGVDWMDAAEPIWDIGKPYGIIFVLFVLSSVLGILNVVVSMFVERAATLKKSDRDFAISDELLSMKLDMKETLALFHVLDPEGEGQVSLESLLEFLQLERIIAHFATLGIDVSDQRRIAHLLDPKDDGCITLSDFVSGVISLRGSSNKADAMITLEMLREVLESFDKLSEDVIRLHNMSIRTEKCKPLVEAGRTSVADTDTSYQSERLLEMNPQVVGLTTDI